MDVHLLSLLKEFGIRCDSAGRRGWQALTNGELVKNAIEAGFQCLLMQDRLFAEAAGRALKMNKDFSVVIVELPQKPWKLYHNDFRKFWVKNPIKPKSGKVIIWP